MNNNVSVIYSHPIDKFPFCPYDSWNSEMWTSTLIYDMHVS